MTKAAPAKRRAAREVAMIMAICFWRMESRLNIRSEASLAPGLGQKGAVSASMNRRIPVLGKIFHPPDFDQSDMAPTLASSGPVAGRTGEGAFYQVTAARQGRRALPTPERRAPAG